MGLVYTLFEGSSWEPATRVVTHAARGNGTRAAAVVLTALPAVPLPGLGFAAAATDTDQPVAPACAGEASPILKVTEYWPAMVEYIIQPGGHLAPESWAPSPSPPPANSD
jgi:hypothetical protein